MSDNEINKFYVSPYDEFMYEFDAKHPKSASQQEEIAKHQRLHRIRDDKEYVEPKSGIWEGF